MCVRINLNLEHTPKEASLLPHWATRKANATDNLAAWDLIKYQKFEALLQICVLGIESVLLIAPVHFVSGQTNCFFVSRRLAHSAEKAWLHSRLQSPMASCGYLQSVMSKAEFFRCLSHQIQGESTEPTVCLCTIHALVMLNLTQFHMQMIF